ncbi:MAG: SRPBCC family protein [Chloroflexota bacterium]
MGRVSASLQLAYPVDRVFAVATRIETLPEWLPEVAAAQLVDPTLSVGSRVRLRMGAAAGHTEIVGTVKQYRPPNILAIGGSAGPLSIDVRTRLDPVNEAVTRIVLEIEISAPPLMGFIGREAERRINAELHPSLERLRGLLDAEAQPA